MKAALLIVLSLSALAFASPAFNKNTQQNQNEYNTNKQQQQQLSYKDFEGKQTQATEILKQWCFSSHLSQPELTSSFKKLVNVIKSSPEDQITEAQVMTERVCQGVKSPMKTTTTTGANNKDQNDVATIGQQQIDAQAHELIKDVYMDALVACEKRECTKQLTKIINSNKIDNLRASYYMTRIAITEKDSIKDETEIKELADSFTNDVSAPSSEAVERQRLFAITSLIGKSLNTKPESVELKQVAEQVAKTIVDRYVKTVSEQEIQQYVQQQQVDEQLIKKIAKRSAAIKALCNIPGFILKDIQQVDEILKQLVDNKQELVTVRQSAIECLEQNESAIEKLKQLAFNQEEPIEVRVAALRALMTALYAPINSNKQQQKDESYKMQQAQQIIEQLIKHCEEQRNQQQDDQFVLYAVSHLDNLRTSQQPEHKTIKETIAKNKQHYMQIQLLVKKLKQQLNDVRKSSRNYKFEQEFNQIESGLIVEGDLVYESKHKSLSSYQNLPKVVRVNVSMPVMGKTVNVVELVVRQNEMDEEMLSALKMIQGGKFTSESVSKVVDTFAKQQQQQQQSQQNKKHVAEADLTIKVDGCTIVYLCVDDFKTQTSSSSVHRQTRSIYNTYSIIDQVIEHLKRNPVAFNRAVNFNINKRLASVLDIDAHIIAGLRIFSQASGQSSNDFEVVTTIEPRFGFESIVGPAKMSSKKLLQRLSTKTALGLRLRYKSDELVDVQLDLPMNIMELFTFESQLIKKVNEQSYSFLPESIYGQEDIYSRDLYANNNNKYDNEYDQADYEQSYYARSEKMLKKRSIFTQNESTVKSIAKLFQGKTNKITVSLETPEKVARSVGLRGKLRYMVSPKDMSVFVQAICQKYEPSMRGFRFQLQKVERGSEHKQYLLQVSTPGSSIDRTMQVRFVQQSNSQRTVIKSDIQSPRMGATIQCELIHDGRVYALKLDAVSTRGQQWRHSVEAGFQRQSTRVSNAVEPYLKLDSSYLTRPVHFQGLVSYQEMPKSVIIYELKCLTSGDFVKGKIILDKRTARHHQFSYTKRSMRSMQSPIELMLTSDLILTSEFNAEIGQHRVKLHKMFDWDSSKWSLVGDLLASHQNRVSQIESQLIAKMKLDKEMQMVSVERKCPQQVRKEFRYILSSEFKMPATHVFVAEYRFAGRRSSNAIVSYKHKLDYSAIVQSSNKYDCSYQVELVDTERQINEKLTGRARVSLDRRVKTLQAEVQGHGKMAKCDIEFVSLEQHQIDLVFQGDRYQHKTVVRANQRQFSVQSRTDKRSQMIAKLVVELSKQSPQKDCQLIVELPTVRCHLAADLKLASGRLSSLAVQTPRFASKTEFQFERLPTYNNNQGYPMRVPFFGSLFDQINMMKFKSDLKDTTKQEAYWVDSAWNGVRGQDKSYFRLDSPYYRSDVEFDPRKENTKFGLYARSNKNNNKSFFNDKTVSENDYEQSSLFKSFDESNFDVSKNKMDLANKLWMVRSMLSSPSKLESLKEKARSVLFEYADRRHKQRHSLNWEPSEERLTASYDRTPYEKQQDVESMRLMADLDMKPIFDSYNRIVVKRSAHNDEEEENNTTDEDETDYSKEQEYNNETENKRERKMYKKMYEKYANRKPSKVSMESEWMNFDMDVKPFDGDESFARFQMDSKHNRSPFRKHESEFRYKHGQGYKGWMKHLDSEEKKHSFEVESDEEPQKWSKLAYESDKLGKAAWEHKWRKGISKRSIAYEPTSSSSSSSLRRQDNFDQEDVYSNKLQFNYDLPSYELQHNTLLQWEEPRDLVHAKKFDFGGLRRLRRNVVNELTQVVSDNAQRRYNAIDYLKHVNARLQSNTSYRNNQANNYKVDFDYQPQQYAARLNIQMPDDLLHSTSVEMSPNDKLYKIASKLYDRRSPMEPEYELLASTKPMIVGLASGEQEPVFMDESHQMLERPINDLTIASLFRQPLKLDYSDKFGRVARFDYDHSPVSPSGKLYAGLRQKRAAVYYRDQKNDIEHQSHYDFYPETLLGQLKPSFKRVPGDMAIKANTKYGPVVVRLDSNEKLVEMELQSPVLNGKLVAETSSQGIRGTKLVKFYCDNKSQTIQLSKLIRKSELLRQIDLLHFWAKKIDEGRFEHQSELLVNFFEAIFKLKSETLVNSRLVLRVEGQVNKPEEKLYVKIDGERTKGHLIVDYERQSMDLVVMHNERRVLEHSTRLVPINQKFYSLESETSYKSKPLFKFTGKISAKLIEQPEHLFRKHHLVGSPEEHISTFEAIVYEPKEVHFTGEFDCNHKQARVIAKNVEDRQVTDVRVKYDERAKCVRVAARRQTSRGISYAINKTIDIAPFIAVY